MESEPITGEQTAITAQSDAGDAQERNPEGEFETLIKGEYKEQYTKRTQALIDKRFKQTKEMESRLAEYAKLGELLSEKYEVSSDDLTALMDSIRADSRTDTPEIEAGALEKSIQTLNLQAMEASAYYPAFQLRQEAANPQFTALVAKGLDMKTAYELCHRRELLSHALKKGLRRCTELVLNDIRARGMRPAENGYSGVSTAIGRPDVHSFTRQQREEIARRVLRGERITF